MKSSHYKLPILIYDEECPLCVRFMQGLELLPGTDIITKIPVQDEQIYLHFDGITQEKCMEEIHFIDSNGKILRGNAVGEAIINLFPAAKKFLWLIESDVGKRTIDYFHDIAAKYRKRLKKDCPGCNCNKKSKRSRVPDIGA